jgi:hypothetical protein
MGTMTRQIKLTRMADTSNEEDQGRRRKPDGGGEEEKEMKIMTVVSRPPTAAREPVGIANVNINGIMKTSLRKEHYYTSPNRVRPPGAEIPQDINLATSFSNPNAAAAIEPASESSENDGTAAREPACIECDIHSGSRGSENETINDARESGN